MLCPEALATLDDERIEEAQHIRFVLGPRDPAVVPDVGAVPHHYVPLVNDEAAGNVMDDKVAGSIAAVGDVLLADRLSVGAQAFGQVLRTNCNPPFATCPG